MGFDLNGIKEQAEAAVDNVENVINEKVGNDVVNDEINQQAKDKVGEVIDGIAGKFGQN